MPKTTTVASSSSTVSTNDDLYVRELPYLTNENFADSQLKYLAEIPVRLGQKVYYISDEEKLTLFAEGIKEGKWLALLNNEDALHIALGAFMFDRKINYWELVTFIHIYQLAKKFRPSALFGTFEENFRQHPLFKKDANNITWSDEAVKMFVPGHYYMFELAAKKSLPPSLSRQDRVEMVKRAADKKMQSLLVYIAEHCPVNQQFFIEFNDKALGFHFDNGATYILSDIFMAMHRDQGRVDIAPYLTSIWGVKTIFHPFSLLNAIGEFVYQQDYVTPLPKLGLFGSRRLYGTAKSKRRFWRSRLSSC